jgi:hypothetical protein
VEKEVNPKLVEEILKDENPTDQNSIMSENEEYKSTPIPKIDEQVRPKSQATSYQGR